MCRFLLLFLLSSFCMLHTQEKTFFTLSQLNFHFVSIRCTPCVMNFFSLEFAYSECHCCQRIQKKNEKIYLVQNNLRQKDEKWNGQCDNQQFVIVKLFFFCCCLNFLLSWVVEQLAYMNIFFGGSKAKFKNAVDVMYAIKYALELS